MLIHLLSSLIEATINTAIGLSDNLEGDLKAVANQELSIEIHDIALNLSLIYNGKKMSVIADRQASAKCAIRCNLETLAKLQDPANVTALIRQEKLDLEGDLKLAQNYSAAFSQMNINWSDQLSNVLGDALSYQLVEFMKQRHLKTKQKKQRIEQVTKELLQDELAVAVHPIELDIFKQQNRTLTTTTAKLEQRINKLLAK